MGGEERRGWKKWFGLRRRSILEVEEAKEE
jgi:hypothetical protein